MGHSRSAAIETVRSLGAITIRAAFGKTNFYYGVSPLFGTGK